MAGEPKPGGPAPEETLTRRGGRRIELYAPIGRTGRQIASIDIAPVKLDHVERWSAGQIKGSLALLADLTGLDAGTLRELTYPDVDRVLGAFMAMLPAAIRADIDAGMTPQAAPMPDAGPPDAATVEGHGFDLGKEQN